MTYEEKEVLSAKLIIAENQTWLEANSLRQQADEILRIAETVSARCDLLRKAQHDLWSLDETDATEPF